MERKMGERDRTQEGQNSDPDSAQNVFVWIAVSSFHFRTLPAPTVTNAQTNKRGYLYRIKFVFFIFF